MDTTFSLTVFIFRWHEVSVKVCKRFLGQLDRDNVIVKMCHFEILLFYEIMICIKGSVFDQQQIASQQVSCKRRSTVKQCYSLF